VKLIKRQLAYTALLYTTQFPALGAFSLFRRVTRIIYSSLFTIYGREEINKHTYTNTSTRHIENKQQSINIAGIHLNGKIYIKLSLSIIFESIYG